MKDENEYSKPIVVIVWLIFFGMLVFIMVLIAQGYFLR